ncbi:sigma-70 family RNA polymerase sigma factor [Marinoscillum sp. 108]|uniref:sigma-70 family RNA polymerase sigma factor n=1 Tax=Marinoscillum sp. 108 TaxID=2653151 RepID=UPI0012F376A6|nr:sigma-70 family RNA polymerase sigma factor [Marinoscillum sp. 108]VXD16500.1 RNA polymerase subunit sigma [Marinoscillum sp. 108]
MTHSANITLYQPLLQSIAFKMLGCMHDAEDMVQDAFLKYLAVDPKKIENTKAYLIRSVTNNCLNHLNSLKQKKKEYLESVKLPELFEKIDFSSLDFRQELDAMLSVLHKKLGPLERGLYLLREGFDFEYDELQQIFNKKKDHCRQMVCRAKEKLARETDKFTYSFDSEKYFSAFQKACSDGNFDDLINHLNDEQKEIK